jgi:hypothetical protein
LGVKNGELGKIIDIQEEIIKIVKDDKNTITLDISTYNYIDHGYATTIHKSQGTTVDNTYVYASPHMDKHLTYVALTRHKEDVQMYVDTNIIPNKHILSKVLSKEAPKENALDYINTPNQVIDLTPDDQQAFMQRRSISHSPSSNASYISWDAIKEFTYNWSQTKDWMFGENEQTQQEDIVEQFHKLQKEQNHMPEFLYRTPEQKEQYRKIGQKKKN